MLSSCANKYGLIVGAQKENYQETASAFVFSSAGKVSLPKYNNSSTGFHFGISEESDYLLSKIYFFSNSYGDKDYVSGATTYKTSLSESGIAATIGLKLWWFQPFLGFKSYESEYVIDGASTKDNYSALYYGIDMEVPLSNDWFLYLGYGANEKVSIGTIGAAVVTQTRAHSDLKIGLRWNFVSFGGSSK